MANEKKKPSISNDKKEWLNPSKDIGCVTNFVEQGMSQEEARKHCNDLWKDELRRRDSERTVPV